MHRRGRRGRHSGAALVVGLALIGGMSACGSDSSGTTAAGKEQAAKAPAVGFGLSVDPEVAKLVPSSVKGKVLNNAIYNDGAPQQFLEHGKLVGIQPDLANAVSEVMGVKFKTIPVGSFDSIIPGLQGGRYDLAFADFGITAEREKVVDFVEQFTLGTSFGVKTGSGKAIAKEDDLCGVKLGTLAGSYFLDQVRAIGKRCVAARKPAITVQSYPTQSAAVLAVANSRADAYAVSTDQLAYAAKQTHGQMTAQPFVYEPIPQGVGIPKGSPLSKPLQAAIRALIRNGTYAKILDKWGISASAITADQVAINPVSGT